jgi:predicted nucleic acid-binding protein
LTVLVDTSVLYALLARDSDEHEAASRAFADLSEITPLTTHSYVVVETVTLLQRRLGMPAVEAFLQSILPALNVVWVEPTLHNRALAAFRRAASRSVSLCDRVSFTIMRDLGIDTALAFDPDFAHEGFRVVP